MTPTYCHACDNVHTATRGDDPWRWRCLKAPVTPGYGFVSATYAPHPPYEKCDRRNTKGECPDFSPRREAHKEAAE